MGWCFIRSCYEVDSELVSRLLQDIHVKTEQIHLEGTFSDSIGTSQDEFWEEFLTEHEIRDQILHFEVRAIDY